MLMISHRGNTKGPTQHFENHPERIVQLLAAGTHVEVDVHGVYGALYLGHDAPIYEVSQQFLMHKNLWCHAKNHEALDRMLDIGAHCFGHDADDYVLTSRGFIWCHPRLASSLTKNMAARSVIVMPPPDIDISQYYGVCTDYMS